MEIFLNVTIPVRKQRFDISLLEKKQFPQMYLTVGTQSNNIQMRQECEQSREKNPK